MRWPAHKHFACEVSRWGSTEGWDCQNLNRLLIKKERVFNWLLRSESSKFHWWMKNGLKLRLYIWFALLLGIWRALIKILFEANEPSDISVFLRLLFKTYRSRIWGWWIHAERRDFSLRFKVQIKAEWRSMRIYQHRVVAYNGHNRRKAPPTPTYTHHNVTWLILVCTVRRSSNCDTPWSVVKQKSWNVFR